MTKIDEAQAEKIAEDFAREKIRLVPVKDTSGLTYYGSPDFSDFHVFYQPSDMNMVGASSYVAVSKVDGSVHGFKCSE